MLKGILASILFFIVIKGEAQLGIMKMVGKNTSNYSYGIGAYIKGVFPVSQAADLTLEMGANIFFLNDDGIGDGTAVVPIKAGYRYSLNGTGFGLYVEPQIGYNIYGVTSAYVDGSTQNFKFHGVVLAAGTGYLFRAGNTPLDLNLHYETIIDHGGSDNYISLGISFYLRFGKRDTD
ncbi:MAG TPA: hypothetical protein VFI33_11675 [Puia sp.]|nr:hypothetical protein [Puia sp.]